jgi:transposase
MSKNLFTEYQIKELEKNPNVLRVSERAISYKFDFKVKAVMEYKSGKIPSQIFIENGFNLEVIGKHQPKDVFKDGVIPMRSLVNLVFNQKRTLLEQYL